MLSACIKQYARNLTSIYYLCPKHFTGSTEGRNWSNFCLSLNRNPSDSDIQVWYMILTTLSHFLSL